MNRGAEALIKLMARLPAEKDAGAVPHYRYDSGREGDICRIGFPPRKGQTVLYRSVDLEKHAKTLAQLGRHR